MSYHRETTKYTAPNSIDPGRYDYDDEVEPSIFWMFTGWLSVLLFLAAVGFAAYAIVKH